jgi:two-component system response regulator MprA
VAKKRLEVSSKFVIGFQFPFIFEKPILPSINRWHFIFCYGILFRGGSMKEYILIIEDDEAIVRVLKRALAYESYRVEAALDGEAGLALAREHHPDLVILDWMLPGMDGLEVCQRLRAGGNQPILMLTAKDTIQDRVQGLDAGVDDYVVKPFELDELMARIRALLRRTQPERAPVLSFADLSLDTSTRQATRKGRIIPLTAKEYDLLELFMRHPRQVLTREMIFDRVWGYDFGGESNVLDVYIRYLRQKLEGVNEIRLIHTLRGVGYVLRENP